MRGQEGRPLNVSPARIRCSDDVAESISQPSPGWADVWLPALRAWVRFEVYFRVPTQTRKGWGSIRRRPERRRRGTKPGPAPSRVTRSKQARNRSQSPSSLPHGWLALAARLRRPFLCQECQDLANNLKCRPNGSYIKPDRFGRTFVKLYLT
jgi:hypothetical protein